MTTRAARRTATVDWLAIAQVTELGHRLHLLEPERSEVIRRLYGDLDAEQLAWRLCITARTVKRLANRLGLTARTGADSPAPETTPRRTAA
ncbi:hypothetical protein I3U63_22950 [Mycobacteroides abscessus subsp. massiliense]|uniref:hypothetical protein n=1 Tax=Mycobacteroides abscessus TaxID=36809 RepID=UPI0019D246FA|nr:hypothetical protein [Mycobacteroides abscessus]MBN7324375.1 hypothetical protein [Mycobacteroides abscessus subsp. massiliense]